MHTLAYGTQEKSASLSPVQFTRQPVRAGEVEIEITHCGVCHSDLHQARDDWSNTVYPCVPGHEIIGKVTRVGDGVSKFSEGETVGVGCMVNSCQACEACRRGEEQYCSGPKSCTLTYNGPKIPDGTNTYGGYATGITVREEFVLNIPDAISPAEAAPILCAGVTTYSPMKHWNLQKGQSLGVAGIGGLGHMAVQIGKALGASVTALTTSADKSDLARELGADTVIVMSDETALKDGAQSLDMLIDTIPYAHDVTPYIKLMKPGGVIALVGNFIEMPAFVPADLVFHRLTLAGSLIGGITDTAEVLELCAEHGIRPQIELIDIDGINEAFKRMEGEDVRFRHVIDMSSLKSRRDELTPEASEIAAPNRGDVTG
ncbi:NAD(P)-dependent alcohol dehydrogenase [Hyphomonas sp.]|uniref:NAD(P)-dependent alcohol dehydrogenase n=1 Tax=Hyphomonas sp. TaxID=87 RepID=UPI000AA28284|nr:NAD(P)-dependent alcohol dehydrogenase [Hyphomonas sp.]